MTPGERMVWAAVYAATWNRLTAANGLTCRMTQERIATDSANEAGYAVVALRKLSSMDAGTAHLKSIVDEAREIIGDKP